jgi:hypothetical protein
MNTNLNMENKVCTACLLSKDRSEFHVRRASKDGLRTTCKPCTADIKAEYHKKNSSKIIEKVRLWRRNNRERKNENSRKHSRKYDLKKHYGMSLEDYDRMLLIQNGRCAICSKAPRNSSVKTRFLHVDHDHATGTVRGLLCDRCNHMLGKSLDNPDTLRRAAIYLEQNSNE